MNILRIKLILYVLLLATTATAQKLKKEDKLTLANLKTHIAYLADDKLEGRRAGSNGENTERSGSTSLVEPVPDADGVEQISIRRLSDSKH